MTGESDCYRRLRVCKTRCGSTAQVLETVCHMLDHERQRRKELEALLVAEDEPTQAEQQEPLHFVGPESERP